MTPAQHLGPQIPLLLSLERQSSYEVVLTSLLMIHPSRFDSCTAKSVCDHLPKVTAC